MDCKAKETTWKSKMWAMLPSFNVPNLVNLENFTVHAFWLLHSDFYIIQNPQTAK